VGAEDSTENQATPGGPREGEEDEQVLFGLSTEEDLWGCCGSKDKPTKGTRLCSIFGCTSERE